MRIKIGCFLLLMSCFFTQAQQITGKWKVIDEDSGKAKCIINISQTDDSLTGKITKLLKKNAPDNARCVKCEGKLKDEPLIGLPILRGFTKEDGKWVDGLITDPEKGKTYESKIWVDKNNPDLLKVRGYVSVFYRTQTWERVKE